MKLLTHERQWRDGETVVALGMFDGVHEGHAMLMRKANELGIPVLTEEEFLKMIGKN